MKNYATTFFYVIIESMWHWKNVIKIYGSMKVIYIVGIAVVDEKEN